MSAMRRRILTRGLTRSAALLAVLATACLDDRPVGPNEKTGPTVRFGLNATILDAKAGQTVRIRAFYRRTNQTDVTLPSSPTSVSVTPGEPKQVAVVVRIADCLADPQQAGGSKTQCAVGVDWTLEDEGGTPIDEQTTEPAVPLPPGSKTTLAEIVFAPVAQVAFNAVPVLRIGDIRTLIAAALDAQGKTLTTRKIKWTSDNPSVLSINATTGSATAVAVGSTKVTATAGTRSASLTVKVIRRVSTVVLSPDPASVVAARTLQLAAIPKTTDGTDAGDLADRDVRWSVVNPTGAAPAATVSATGLVTGIYPGNADVTVSIDGVTKTLRVVVTSSGLTIEAPATMLVGTTAVLTATVVDANGGSLANVPVSWSTSDPTIATISGSGVLTAVAAGSVQVTATSGTSTATATVRVIRPVSSIVVSPDPGSVVAARTLQLVAVPKTTDGTDAGDLADRDIQWSVANLAGAPVTATVSATGLVTGVYPGNADVTVSIDGVTKTVRVVVTAAGLTIQAPATMLVGTTAALTATVVDADGVALANVPVSWSTSAPNIATISGSGVLTAVAAGSVQVTATSGTSTATATVRVIRPVATVTLGPAPASVVAARTLQLVATAKAADGTDINLADRDVTWSVANPAGPTRATVSTTGKVTGLYPGDADVTVSVDGVTKTLRVTVVAASIRIDSPSTFMFVGNTMPLTATVLDADNVPLANVPVTWSTSNSSFATVDANGRVRGVGSGYVFITATGGGVSATIPIHVNP